MGVVKMGMSSVFQSTRTRSGQYVSPETAMRASSVLACIRILTEDLSALPLNLYRRTPHGDVLATEHPLFRLLHDTPNPWQTSMELREALILDVLCYGQAYVEKEFGPDGISALYPRSAGLISRVDPLGAFIPAPVQFFRYTDPRAGARTLLSDDLWITRMLAPAGVLEGQALVLLAREAIGLAQAAEEQGARLFSQGTQTDLVISTEDPTIDIDDAAREQLRDAFTRRHSGVSNAWLPMILSGGLKASRIGLTAQESQYIETRSFQLQDIARIFRIPDVLLGVAAGKTATYASAEQFFLAYVKHTLQPWCQRIEQSIQRDLLAPSESEYYVRHDLDALTRADLATRYDAHASGIAAGFLTRNEARQMERLPILPGLDEPLSPLNMQNGANNGKSDALALQLAKNAFAHETKLLSDGKSPTDIYSRLLPGYLPSKTGLSPSQCAEYCHARLAGESDGIGMLTALIAKV